ncbi:DUF4468 domain-containing protein [Dyadobacter psychrotolerans]|uniref:DUF4468 domain-containing protein n=1 Tax=Dyadobacter psychrotolerans TaxID=2541721 RepID=A0A4R5DSI3_9BACT|nr:DUF4468 domain-containing protein [Dyadobacter psychrotolerans]TDE17392.1 DUF4468 domain-containing protein [Dyadobacter psychrotolerans]
MAHNHFPIYLLLLLPKTTHIILNCIKLFLLFFVSFNCLGQDGLLPIDTRKQVYYSDLVNTDKTKDELYKIAQNWVTRKFGNYDIAVTFQDAAAGKLVINSYVPVKHSLYDHIRFDLTIICKDNNYQASIEKLDGIAQTRSPKRLGPSENDAIAEKSMAVKTETNRKKKQGSELLLQKQQADNDQVNAAMYKLLASLKEFISEQ